MEEGRCARLVILLLAVFLGIGLTSIPVLGISAAPVGAITVCQAGPPQCDYQTIQAGIDAAGAGDTVLVSAGTYSEQLTLKSGVTIQSEHGPETVTVTASSQPIVSASGVVSVVVRGVSVVGQGAVSPAVGIEIASSEVTVSDCVVRDVHGANGDEAHHDGGDAAAIRSMGSVLTITGSIIQDLSGGNAGTGYDESADGGSAVGVWASGGERVFTTETIIHRLEGGDAYSYYPDSCGQGGQAVGVHAEDEVDLVVVGSEFVELRGGEPYKASGGPWSVFSCAGTPTGVEAVGGTVVLRDNLFEDFWLRAAVTSEPGYAVHTSSTLATHLEGNTIISLWVELPPYRVPRASWPEAASYAPLVPWGPFEGGSVIAVACEGDASLRAIDNSLSDLRGVYENGEAIGILARDVGSVVLSGNSITGVIGGYSIYRGPEVTAVGIRLEEVGSAEISVNEVGEIHGGDLQPAALPSRGGGAFGIDLEGVQEAAVTNNSIWSLSGGDGSTASCYLEKGSGATALRVVGGATSAWNNVLHQTTAGIGGWDFDGEPGSAVGLYLGQGADVLAINNVIISHTIGISSTAHSVPILAYNALWDNDTNYASVFPGVGDLYVDPRFADADDGDFHLRSDSPLIDAGTNAGAPSEDFEGEPRPLDGNGDGYVRVDVGADEYWPGIVGSKEVQPSIAASGGVLTYQLVFSNASSHDPLSVTLTDALSGKTTYVSGTLWATAGLWDYSDGLVTWTGAMTPGEVVTLTFNAVVDGGLVEPYVILNQADLDDHVGKARVLGAIALVNPIQYYFPLLLVQ
jgi:uncharacterized repeat protein (TIGR01451 family)